MARTDTVTPEGLSHFSTAFPDRSVPPPSDAPSLGSAREITNAVKMFRRQIHIIYKARQLGCSLLETPDKIGTLPGIFPEHLGDRTFQEVHKVRFPYICGAMANGIASPRLVKAAAASGLLAFFGAAGLPVDRIAADLHEIRKSLGPRNLNWGSDLIHTPNEPGMEDRTVDLYLEHKMRWVSASAFTHITPAVVRYACTGLHETREGIQRVNHLFAKISRPETARFFMLPAPDPILADLVRRQKLTEQEATLARRLPLSEDIAVEGDSAGHTDRQVLQSLFPTILKLRNALMHEYAYPRPIRMGAAGGIGSPAGAASAFTMGAAFILTGSINQACVESGLSDYGKSMLAQVNFGDTSMCAAADMFEQGVKLQVLKRGSMYAVRANWLYELYRQYDSLDALPGSVTQRLEKDIFRKSIGNAWADTKQYWQERDPSQLALAEQEPKHKMALTFRSYLGLSSRWAMEGKSERKIDMQIWCGPAMAAFNAWTKGSFLEKPENRNVGQLALNLLEGAAQITRATQVRSLGIPVPAEAYDFHPREIL